MKKCKVCGKPLKKLGRTEHYGCRMFRIMSKKIEKNGMADLSGNKFETATKTLDKNPELLLKRF